MNFIKILRRAFVPYAVLLVLLLLVTCTIARAQDNGDAGEPVVSSIDPTTLTYDILVDGNLTQDDPAHNKYKTLQAAYAAAPAGTSTRQTVIGIMPNVYAITGGITTPGMTITKNYITLLGITNNRRSVVLADNRGNQAGSGTLQAGYDGDVIDVHADGFRMENLTVLNYCNVDYEYPGDSSKNLSKRAAVETQAVAIQMSGDKHIYKNVAFLSRLDTTSMSMDRAYFSNVFIEGTSDFIGGGRISYWENSEVQFPAGFTPVMSVGNPVFVNTKFTSSRGMEFYKMYGSPAVVLNSTFPVSSTQFPVAWVDTDYNPAPTMPNNYSFTYRNKDTAGNPAVIVDNAVGPVTYNVGKEMPDELAAAYNPWNLLRAMPTGTPADDWDPAGVKSQYEAAGQGSLPFRVVFTSKNGGNADIRTGDAGVEIDAAVYPDRADQTITWTTSSPLITLSGSTGPSVTVTGSNTTNRAQYVAVNATSVNGYYATAWIYVEPQYIAPPVPTAPPSMSAPSNGQVTVTYPLTLGDLLDQSLVSWFACDDASGSNPRPIVVSRGNVPLNIYTLTPGDVGKYLLASIQPKSNISDPGPAITVTSATPILITDIRTMTVNPSFRNFPTDTNANFVSGRWTVTGGWSTPVNTTLSTGYGFRVNVQGSRLMYQNDNKIADMQVDVVLSPEKTAGQGFGSAGSGADTPAPIQNSDIYIKYDPRTQNGYALRFWRTRTSSQKCMFQFYEIASGVGTPVSTQQAFTGVLKQNTTITLKMIGSTLTATGYNTVDQEVLSLQETVPTNDFGGAGVYWDGTTPTGNSVSYGMIKISYPGAAQLSLTKSSIAFGSQLVGPTSGVQSVTLTNTGTSALIFSGATITGANASAFGSTNTCETTIPVGGNCNILVSFTPAALGNYQASLQVIDDADDQPQTITLSGTGVIAQPAVSLNKTQIAFGNQIIGTSSAAQTVTLTNTGTQDMTFLGTTITGDGASAFSASSTCGSIVAVGSNCTISVIFSPASSGSYQAALQVADNAGDSPQTIALSGTGASVPDFSLSTNYTTMSLAPGTSKTVDLAVNAANGFAGIVALTCSSPLAGSSCSLSQSTVQTGGAVPHIIVTVVAPSNTVASNASKLPRFLGGIALSLCLLGWKRKNRIAQWSILFVVIATLPLFAGCGGSHSHSAQTYTVTVTGTSGNLQHTAQIDVIVH